MILKILRYFELYTTCRLNASSDMSSGEISRRLVIVSTFFFFYLKVDRISIRNSSMALFSWFCSVYLISSAFLGTMAAESSRGRQNYSIECEAAVNKQINVELCAYHQYLALVSWNRGFFLVLIFNLSHVNVLNILGGVLRPTWSCSQRFREIIPRVGWKEYWENEQADWLSELTWWKSFDVSGKHTVGARMAKACGRSWACSQNGERN